MKRFILPHGHLVHLVRPRAQQPMDGMRTSSLQHNNSRLMMLNSSMKWPWFVNSPKQAVVFVLMHNVVNDFLVLKDGLLPVQTLRPITICCVRNSMSRASRLRPTLTVSNKSNLVLTSEHSLPERRETSTLSQVKSRITLTKMDCLPTFETVHAPLWALKFSNPMLKFGERNVKDTLLPQLR